jgi:hypothetical protein
LETVRLTLNNAVWFARRFLRRVAAAADWYCGKMSRERVEKVVGKSETGSYLVRQSEKKPDDFVLVVKSATVVMSYKIVRSDVGFTIRGDTYASMESVIRQIHKNPLQNADGQSQLTPTHLHVCCLRAAVIVLTNVPNPCHSIFFIFFWCWHRKPAAAHKACATTE